MNNNIMTDLGENYQYIKTIANNTVELKKIELSESAATLIGKLVLYTVIGAIACFSIVICLIMLGVFLYNVTGSVTISLASLLGLSVITMIILFLVRKSFIYRPITRAIYSTILKITD